jgi:hypothetical protein
MLDSAAGHSSEAEESLSLAYHKLASQMEKSAMRRLCFYPLPTSFARHSHEIIS